MGQILPHFVGRASLSVGWFKKSNNFLGLCDAYPASKNRALRNFLRWFPDSVPLLCDALHASGKVGVGIVATILRHRLGQYLLEKIIRSIKL